MTTERQMEQATRIEELERTAGRASIARALLGCGNDDCAEQRPHGPHAAPIVNLTTRASKNEVSRMAEHLVSNSDLLLQLGKLEGQVGQILQLMQANHTATNQRLDDMRAAFNARMDGHDTRLERIESRERSTAIKAAASGALSGMVTSMIAAAVVTAIKGG